MRGPAGARGVAVVPGVRAGGDCRGELSPDGVSVLEVAVGIAWDWSLARAVACDWGARVAV